ncbi:hypothetical protein BO71DRAFT_358790 [Aspergillus ellipticus CBS 707.79]|uniref:HNH nuclease domain-containing protein n=1 Tax=Aspergillus ellipticus CBS 707.79 TaxID=1448320 RepID=A0A319D3A4_9EURO|nr:hypothetical protein BO71DRAFT_358790 [Aspergillus ellipticus CBS 707.79]
MTTTRLPVDMDFARIWANRTRIKDPDTGATTPTGSPSTPVRSKKRYATGEFAYMEDPVTEALSPKKPRSQRAVDQCLTRDDGACVITHADQVVIAAHIFPFSLGSKSETFRRRFWSSLRVYWTQEHIDQWRNALLGDDGTETCRNLITLSPSAHAYWDRCLFALKPRPPSADMKTMEVEFLWLPATKRKHIPSRMLLTTRPDLPSDRQSTGRCVKLMNGHTDHPVKSGDIITLKTNDPDEFPLPSYELLQMQWVLHRIAAIRGAADDDEEEETGEDLELSWGSFETVPVPVPSRPPISRANEPRSRSSVTSSSDQQVVPVLTSDDSQCQTPLKTQQEQQEEDHAPLGELSITLRDRGTNVRRQV